MAQDKETPTTASSTKTIVTVGVILLALFGLSYYINVVNTSDDETMQADEAKQVDVDKKAAADKESADKSEVARQKAATGEPVDTTESEDDANYSYVAGTGESYTMLARKAIAKADSNLSHAERVAAETKLTQDADASYLEIGQAVTIAKSDVKSAVTWAKALSDEQKAAWQYYADQIAW